VTRPVHIHFETRTGKPAVFYMTAPAIEAARTQAQAAATVSVNEDPHDMSWLVRATGLVTSNDVLKTPDFPLYDLARLAPHLRWIHIIGAGIEPLLPLDWLPDKVTLTNNSGVHVAKTRESVLMALLMLNARLPAMMTNQRNHRWQPIFTSSIAGRHLLVVGVGDMGGAAASAGRALGLHVTGVRRNGAAHPDVTHMITPDALDTVLPDADFVVLAAPLTPDTRGMFDRRRLGLLKPGAGLFNIGRAGLLDHDALATNLKSGAISGAILDVFDPEPLPADSPLWEVPGLMMMPHVTSDDADAYLPMTYDLVFANADRLAQNKPLINRVDPARGY
jgi:phosphoglycerate dehydrogenase-like enzyme